MTAAQRTDLKVAFGQSLEAGGDVEHAIAFYSDATASDPKRIDAQLRLAALYERQGKIAESRECYRKAIALQPANPDVYCDVGYTLYLESDWPHAAEFLQYALQLKQNHTRAHNNLGLVLARTGQTEEAYAEFKKAGCSNAEAHVNLAYCCMLDGKMAQARQNYQAALQLDPNCAAAKSALHDLNAVVAHLQNPPAGAVTPAASASAERSSMLQAVDWRTQEQHCSRSGECP
jgi:Tfp pilus assembly protein PilF